jgi:excisionase family DNA binding protein
MLNVEIKFPMQGKEVPVDSFVGTIAREVRASVREEISRTRTLPPHEQQSSESPLKIDVEMPRQAVSVREAARMLSISQRTVDKYVALKVIRTVRVGRRVLVPMKSVNEVVAREIPWSRRRASAPAPLVPAQQLARLPLPGVPALPPCDAPLQAAPCSVARLRCSSSRPCSSACLHSSSSRARSPARLPSSRSDTSGWLSLDTAGTAAPPAAAACCSKPRVLSSALSPRA